MKEIQRKYGIASVGVLYWKSLELFATRLEDAEGQLLDQSAIKMGERFRVLFQSGTGLTSTSGTRVL